jgi:hypothetical protein
MDLASKIIKQQKRKAIILKKRKSIIHMLNYVDILSFNLNSNKFNIIFFSKNDYRMELVYNLYLYRTRHFAYENILKVVEHENMCSIRFEDVYPDRVQPKNVNLAAMVMRILEKKENKIDAIIFYCVLLM